MEKNNMVSLGGYLASSVSVTILSSGCKSSAYLPFPIALWLSDEWERILVASAVALFIPFCATVLNYFVFLRKLKAE
jgi:hypothetical protein